MKEKYIGEEWSVPFHKDEELGQIYLAVKDKSCWFWFYKREGQIITSPAFYMREDGGVLTLWAGGHSSTVDGITRTTPPVLEDLRKEYHREYAHR